MNFWRSMVWQFTVEDLRRCTACIIKENCNRTDLTQYQSIIGSLLYLAKSTRPDIQHSVSKLAQFNSDPHEEHLKLAKHILRYLNSTKDVSLLYQRTGKSIECYSDADWGGDQTNRKSYSGFVIKFADCPIAWESKKQTAVALSSTEAEYMALCTAAVLKNQESIIFI